MSQRWLRIIAAFVAFAVVAALGVVIFGNFDAAPDPKTGINQATANSFALVLAIALLVGGIVLFGLEYLQTGHLESLASQFSTRTIVLMPVAIAINIVLGSAVANALKIPIYLDSIGTILVGVLAGPIAGAATGFLANVLWSYVIPPPFQYQPAAAFAVVAAVIGLLAGIFGRLGWFRPRPNRSAGELVVGAVVALLVVGTMAFYAYSRFYAPASGPIPLINGDAGLVFVILAWLVVALGVIAVVGFLALLFLRRDLTVAYVVVAGVITGSAAALISAPIAANVFGGVTGSGVDFLVAAFRQAGSDLQAATLQQGLLVDPADKMLTALVVYLVLNAMARRTKARFPQGERLIDEGDAQADEQPPPAPDREGAPA
jgi:hypothetical protein